MTLPTPRLGAALLAAALAAPLPLLGASAAAAAPGDVVASAEGRIIVGHVLGTDVAALVDLGGARATNDGSEPTQTVTSPLDAEVLGTVDVERDPAPQVDLGDVVEFGPVAQYARAAADGSALGASGAVADDGAIGLGGGSDAPPTDATLHLGGLLGPQFASALADLRLRFGAIAAQARTDGAAAQGDYRLAEAVLEFDSPALAGLDGKVTEALGALDDGLLAGGPIDGLLGEGGTVGDLGLDAVAQLRALDPLLGGVGADALVSIRLDDAVLRERVAAALDARVGSGAVEVDLETGAVRVDLAALLGGSLEGLPPGTELLSDDVVSSILDAIAAELRAVEADVLRIVDDELQDATVEVSATASTGDVVHRVCDVVRSVVGSVPVLGDATLAQRLEALAAGTIGSLTDGVRDGVGDLVVDADGAVRVILGFDPVTADREVCSDVASPALSTVTLDASVGRLDAARLLGDGSGRDDVAAALDDLLIDPALEALLGDGDGSIGDALRDVVSVRANVQELAAAPGGGSTFTQSAVRVTVGGGDLATLSLATASVGPNVTGVTGNPGDPGTGVGGSLAFTGLTVAAGLLVALAALAGGIALTVAERRRGRRVTVLAPTGGMVPQG